MVKRIGTTLLLLGWLLASSLPVVAQDGVNNWTRYQVNITIKADSSVQVQEIQEVALAGGATSFQKVIPTTRVERVEEIVVAQVTERGQQPYQLADTQAPYTFEVISEGDRTVIQLHFPSNAVASTRFTFNYTLLGALSFYEAGDRFAWRPLGDGLSAPVQNANVTVMMPAPLNQQQVQAEAADFGQVNVFNEGSRVLFTGMNITPGSQPEISLTFPHGLVQGSPPAWQKSADSLAYWTPILKWGSLLAGLLVLVVGPLAVYGWWYSRLRVAPDRKGKQAKYYKTPPGRLSPAVAGALLNGKVIPQHLAATLVDLAARGALRVSVAEEDEDVISFGDEPEKSADFNLYAGDGEKASRSYETNLYNKLFGHAGANKRKLSGVRNTLFISVPELTKQMELEITKEGYFPTQRAAIRRQYLAFGGAGILMSLVLGLVVTLLLGGRFTYLVGCPFLSLVVAGVALGAVGFALPNRTQVGENEAVRWQAFERYLQELSTKEAAKVRIRFSRLLPYAMAFGLTEEFVKKFAAAKAPIPPWWGQSQGNMSAVSPGGGGQTGRSMGRIRRLKVEDTSSGPMLKQILPEFTEFLEMVEITFTKAPSLAEEKLDFEALEKQQQPQPQQQPEENPPDWLEGF